ncbi:hypothetical protein WJX73_010020 [Symbiochloris irregularis]|uniref:N-acylneuraminate-9-phosphatase n=1 Tax=Symbiochloris irregularis TaxID=706552 RepID=A0AAW1PJ37_9CHLO
MNHSHKTGIGPIKAVFFDFDDTLISTAEGDRAALRAVSELARELCPGVEDKHLLKIWNARFRSSPWDPTYQVPVEEWRARLWQYSLAELGCSNAAAAAPALAQCFKDTRLDTFKLFPGTKGLMVRLTKAGIATVIITNGHAGIQRSKLERTGADALCTALVLGGDEVLAGRQEKPAAGIFLAACQVCGCTPDEAMMVGDSLEADIQGGVNAGLAATVWVNRNAIPLPKGAPTPSYTVTNVLEGTFLQ